MRGTSIHYWASPLERKLCAGQEIILVGGGNSAGQAAVFLSGQVGKVWLMVRGAGLEASMSRYLIDRIKATPNIELVTHSEVVALEGGDGQLSAATWRNVKTGEERPAGRWATSSFSSAPSPTPAGCAPAR